jgi:hypothetical protein
MKRDHPLEKFIPLRHADRLLTRKGAVDRTGPDRSSYWDADGCRRHAAAILAVSRESSQFKAELVALSDMWLTLAALEETFGDRGNSRS